MRAVLWAHDCGLVMFPPFYSVPDFKPEAKRDIRNYVRGGNDIKGTVMFVGGGLEIGVINRLFDFSIHPEYVAGMCEREPKQEERERERQRERGQKRERENVGGRFL